MIKQKLKNSKTNKGFTLVEMVASLLMVTLITGMLFLIVDMAKKSYEDLEKNAEGQILCSTLTNKIQDELRYSTVATSSSGVSSSSSGTSSSKIHDPSFYSINYGTARCRIVSEDRTDDGTENKRLYIVTSDGNWDNGTGYNPLIGNSSYVFDLEADVDISYNLNRKEYTVTLDIYCPKSSIISTTFVVEQLNN